MLDKQALTLCRQITAQLAGQLPTGVTLKHSACQALARRLLDENVPSSTLVPRFMAEFQANLRNYVYVDTPARRTGFSSGGPSGPSCSSGREAR